jgi:U6 snRNA-associated Sm-like protein LSm6
MNIALERCREIADGKVIRNYGDAFVRGNNGIIFFFGLTASC